MKKVLKERASSLSSYELNVLLPILMKGLETKKGKKNAVSTKQILNGLQSNGLRVCERQVTRIINYIRVNDLLMGLMTSFSGYYITNNEEELIGYENHLLKREDSIKALRKSMIRQRKSMFKKPLHKQTQLF